MDVSDSNTALSPGDTLLGYRIERVLGHGGFGITYLAENTALQMRVVIKEYLPEKIAFRGANDNVEQHSALDNDAFRWGMSKFIKEAQTLGRFRHPSIIRVLSVFEENQTAYMVMDYEKGQDLAALLRQAAFRTEANLKLTVRPILDGLSEVHRHGYIHREIKPANILIRDDGTPVLLDFGSARQTAGEATQAMTPLVSAGYAPLEQYNELTNDLQGPWTDIYGLAAVLYFAITGSVPIESALRGFALLNDRPDPIKTLVSLKPAGYSLHFLQAIDWALSFKVAERPQSLAQWGAMLLKDDASGTVLLRPSSGLTQLIANQPASEPPKNNHVLQTNSAIGPDDTEGSADNADTVLIDHSVLKKRHQQSQHESSERISVLDGLKNELKEHHSDSEMPWDAATVDSAQSQKESVALPHKTPSTKWYLIPTVGLAVALLAWQAPNITPIAVQKLSEFKVAVTDRFFASDSVEDVEAAKAAELANLAETARLEEEAKQEQQALRSGKVARSENVARSEEVGLSENGLPSEEAARLEKIARLEEAVRQGEAKRLKKVAQLEEATRRLALAANSGDAVQPEDSVASLKAAERDASARLADAAQAAKAARLADAAKLAEAIKVAEANKLAVTARIAEATKLAEAAREAEAERKAEEARQIEQAISAEVVRRVNAARKADMARAAKAARVAEEELVVSPKSDEDRKEEDVLQLIRDIERNFEDLALTRPESDSAISNLNKLEELSPGHSFVEEGRQRIRDLFGAWIRGRVKAGNLQKAQSYVQSLSLVVNSEADIKRYEALIANARTAVEPTLAPALPSAETIEPSVVTADRTQALVIETKSGKIDLTSQCDPTNWMKQRQGNAFATRTTRKNWRGDEDVPVGSLDPVNLDGGNFFVYAELKAPKIKQYNYIQRLYDADGEVILNKSTQVDSKDMGVDWTVWSSYSPTEDVAVGKWTYVVCEDGNLQLMTNFNTVRDQS